jgi:hypothetical protein
VPLRSCARSKAFSYNTPGRFACVAISEINALRFRGDLACWYKDVNDCGYLTSVIQHRYGESDRTLSGGFDDELGYVGCLGFPGLKWAAPETVFFRRPCTTGPRSPACFLSCRKTGLYHEKSIFQLENRTGSWHYGV